MRIVVVGGGVIGLLTAMECVRAGAEVDLVDQSEIPAPSATSNDQVRVVRALHRGDAALTSAAAGAHDGWLDIERRLGTWFFHQVGALTTMPPGQIAAQLALLTAAGATARVIPPRELPARCPRVRFPAGAAAVFEPAAGAVLAGRALRVMARWLRDQPGVRLYPHRRAVGVDGGGTVRLADGAVLAGDRAIVAAGPWSRDLLPAELRGELTLYRQSMLWYAPMPSREAWAGTPAVLGLGPDRDAWLMPPVAGTLVHLSTASACRAVPEVTDHGTPDHWRAHLAGRFSALLAGFDPAAVIGAADGYYLAETATRGPLLAAADDGTVWAYAACGGMSFKFAPLIACAIADRAMGRQARRTGLDHVDQPRQFAAARREVPA
jgi:glycine/D-amino acid oxidase-like deaminating enzyme